MHSAPILALAGLISSATAVLTGLKVPSVVARNSSVALTLTVGDLVLPCADISVAFVLRHFAYGSTDDDDLLNSYLLEPSKSNIAKNITFNVDIPAIVGNVHYLNAIITSLCGPQFDPLTMVYSAPIKIGEETSLELQETSQASNVCLDFSSPHVPRDSSSCFYSRTSAVVQSSIGLADALVNNINRGDNSTGLENLERLIGYFGYLYYSIKPDCDDLEGTPWPSLSAADSRVRAMTMARQLEDGLNVLQRDVSACEVAASRNSFCEVMKMRGDVSQYYD